MTIIYLILTTERCVKMKNMYLKFGFTLAEVLITLGIIGIVAAITIPGLINTNKAHKLRAQFLKTFSTLQQAFKLMENDDISMDPNTYERREFCENILPKYLTGATICGNSKSAPCYNTTSGKPYKTLTGSNVRSIYLDDGQVLLKDGTLLMCEYNGHAFETWISADINGYNTPPNIWGYDLFTFHFVDGELRAMGDLKTQYEAEKDSNCDINGKSNLNGITCALKAKNDPEYFKRIIKMH